MLSPFQNIGISSGKEETNSSIVEAKNKNDHEIWSAFREGDEAAFIFLYKKYANLLFNYGVKFSSDKEIVKDCLQDFFLYLRNNREKLGDTTSIKLYLLKSFKRRVIDYIIKSNNERKRHKNAIDFHLEIEVSEELKYINAQVQKEQIGKLSKALDNLGSKEKEAVYYFYYEGLGYKEIAELMGFSHISSARRLIYRALRNLKSLFVVFYIFICCINIFI